MNRIVLGLSVVVFLVAASLITAEMLPRPPKQAAALIGPILRDRMRADDAHYSPGSPEWDLEDRLEQLAKNDSPAADTAAVILLDYYLGEHNGEMQLCAVTRRGVKVLPLLEKYRSHKSGLLRPWYWGVALNRSERASMYVTAVDAIQHGKVIGCE